jgi:PhnB protein
VTDRRRLIAPTTTTEEVPVPDVKSIPDGYPQLSPYLAIDGASEAIDFYSKVLGARERMRMPNPDGGVGHAELELGDSLIMIADASEEMGFRSPKSIGGTPVTLSLYVEDVDGVFERALAQGATEVRAIENQFYGDRSGQFEDPFGHRWSISTHVEDVAPDEMERRMSEMMGARD